jgi:hypothetical protein
MWVIFLVGAILFVLIDFYPHITKSLTMDSDYWKNRKSLK